ncbi:hypothetical protein BpHYR1_035408 [Brachionus plicatilis]|uniref:Uncharacterized protein n=1 Tax=Brachionus plicatilis TaxID=10195 RepID=A0A3M7QGY5_BRAPC|nr:hypothetical protein BpHYR1_035408 [Brachionus plicatilis]
MFYIFNINSNRRNQVICQIKHLDANSLDDYKFVYHETFESLRLCHFYYIMFSKSLSAECKIS